ncbi:hypothetical protein [Achromobacter xylosoxidans]|uniref:hypothetical protein n=1 Tax=Alcaligenes xylosoxydans xylosoxydans TaxID=85698 RepID=UPI001F13297F|nr:MULTISPECIES: hypothetical protein [Achromobacter]
MIIQLDDSVLSDDAMAKATTIAAVEALFSAMGRGEHYVLASRMALQQILQRNSNSTNVRAIIRWCVQNYSFLAGITQTVPAGIVVVADGPTKRLASEVWQTSVDEVARAGVRPTVLLAENSVDAKIFKHAAKHFLLSKDLGTASINVEERNGNGSGIAAELENLILRRAEWCLCIPDSDRRCPDGNVGINAQQCATVVGTAAWPVNLRTTSGRELENEVPRTALDVVAASRVPDWRDQIRLLTEACEVDVLSYADIKKGTRRCHTRQLPEGSKERIYWEAANEQYANAMLDDESCPRNGECTDRRECTLLPAVGDGVGVAVLQLFDNESPHASYKMHKSSANFASWLELGRTVAAHGLSPKRMRM